MTTIHKVSSLKIIFQLNSLRNRLEKSDFDECNRYTPQTSESSTTTSDCSTKTSECATSSDEGNAMEHTLRVTVHGMLGFMPCTNQVWTEPYFRNVPFVL